MRLVVSLLSDYTSAHVLQRIRSNIGAMHYKWEDAHSFCICPIASSTEFTMLPEHIEPWFDSMCSKIDMSMPIERFYLPFFIDGVADIGASTGRVVCSLTNPSANAEATNIANLVALAASAADLPDLQVYALETIKFSLGVVQDPDVRQERSVHLGNMPPMKLHFSQLAVSIQGTDFSQLFSLVGNEPL